MFFVFPEEYDESIVDFSVNWIRVRIALHSKIKKNHYINFYFTTSQARIMTENYLGQNDKFSDSIIEETVKEAVNVVGGNLLNLFNDDYNLGIPEVLEVEDNELLKDKYAENGILLNIEEEPFLLLID
jgi:hypothetical protein